MADLEVQVLKALAWAVLMFLAVIGPPLIMCWVEIRRGRNRQPMVSSLKNYERELKSKTEH